MTVLSFSYHKAKPGAIDSVEMIELGNKERPQKELLNFHLFD